jgi:hypothetical protein
MTDKDYDDAVRRIPHLNLTPYVPVVPLEDILEEYHKEKHNTSNFQYGVDTDKNPELIQVVEYLKRNWRGFGVVDITERGDHMIDYFKEDVNHSFVKSLGIEVDHNGFGIYKPTDIGRRMTNTLQYIYSLFKITGRVRFSMLKAGGIIGYHNHEVRTLVDRKKLKKPLIAEGVNKSAIHIPIIDNSKSFHLVTKGWSCDHVSSDRFQLPINAVEFIQHYGINEVWMFNAVHYHKAVNLGSTDRIHLLCYFDHMDEKIRPYIESAIKDYSGPWID